MFFRNAWGLTDHLGKYTYRYNGNLNQNHTKKLHPMNMHTAIVNNMK